MATSINSTFNKSKNIVFNACLSSVATLGYTVINTNKESGFISFETGMSMSSWAGQQLSCTIIELGENKTQVIISGVTKQHGAQVQVYSWGEAEKIAKKVINKVGETLGESVGVESSKTGGCFIATATMGSYDNPKVKQLRQFRDEWILQKSWGESFVKYYYIYGARAAKVIEKSSILKKISYLLIVKPLVYLSEKINNKYEQ